MDVGGVGGEEHVDVGEPRPDESVRAAAGDENLRRVVVCAAEIEEDGREHA